MTTKFSGEWMDLECTEAIQYHKEKTLYVLPMWILAYNTCMNYVNKCAVGTAYHEERETTQGKYQVIGPGCS